MLWYVTLCLQYPIFQENLSVYLGLEHHIKCENRQRQLTIKAENDCRRLHCALRDFSSFLQALGRLTDQFISEAFLHRIGDGLSIVERLEEKELNFTICLLILL